MSMDKTINSHWPEPTAPPYLPYNRERIRQHWWVWLVVGLVLLLGGYFLYTRLAHSSAAPGGAAGGQAGRTTPVVTATARRGDMNIYLNGLGTVTPLNTVTVHTRVDGQINKIVFVEGQVVKEGELLAEIDPRPFQVQLTQAQGQMAKDQAELKNAQMDLERYQELLKENSIAKQQVDTQLATVRQAEGAVKVDQGQLDSAQLQLTYSLVTAPISGRIGLKLVDQGNIVHATDTTGLAVITQLQPIAVVFSLPQGNIQRVMKEMNPSKPLEVDVYDSNLKSKLASGTLAAVDSQIDPSTGTVRMKATYANDDYALFPNQFVNARLLVETRHDVIIVPSAAVQRGPQSTFVYVVKSDDTVELRNIEVGPTEADETIVESDLQPGEVVVTDGVDKLQQGAKVSVGKGGAPTTGKSMAGGRSTPTTGRAGSSLGSATTRPATQKTAHGTEPRGSEAAVEK